MGRIGGFRARWSALSRRRRAAVVAAVFVTAGVIGAGISAASGQGTPAPVVWRDHVADATNASTSPPSTGSTASTASTAGRDRP
jgi:hypothetical protein